MKPEDQEVKALRQMASDPDVPTHLRLGALKELGKRRETPEPVAPVVGDPLTKEERKAVSDAMYWYPLMETWDTDQVELCVRLGLVAQEEYDEHMEAIRRDLPRYGRERQLDELAQRRRKRAS